ncbi:MaoC family dehydratase [Clostridium arbusti]|uniref:MaoC family dehydratase n=1 Tax=Clostridium arbusti TaxID=1137848 RepID=UPI000289013C|nr:MaoC family dehydratase [Clostridium arbusti]
MYSKNIKIGDKASITKIISDENVKQFAKISGDLNPIHISDDYANKTIFKKRIAQGILITGLISAVLANKLPGEGSIYLSQTLKFLKPVFIGDEITAEVEVLDIKGNIVTLYTCCFNNINVDVIVGEAVIMIERRNN